MDNNIKIKENNPLVSVNICTFNRSDMILDAVKSAVNQIYENIEIIISDSGNDDTEKVLSEFIKENPKNSSKIKYFKNTAKNISENRNFALSHSNGKYIAVLDSDDYWIDNKKITEQVNFLEENPEYALIGTNAEIVDTKKNKIGEIKNKEKDYELRKRMLIKNQFIHSSVLFIKQSVDKYDPNLKVWEDYDLFLKIGQKHKIKNINLFTTAYRKHGNNISSKQKIYGVKLLNEIISKYKRKYPFFIIAKLINNIRLLKNLLTK